MLSLLLLVASAFAYDSLKCDCHMMFGGSSGEQVCEMLNICSAEDLDLDMVDMVPIILPGILNAPGIQLTNMIPEESSYFVQNDKVCALCKEVLTKAEQELPQLEPKAEAVCDRFNATVKKLLCQKAIKKAFDEIENLDPEGTCEKIKLCSNSTTPIRLGREQNQLMKPNADYCAICEKVWGFVQQFDDQIKTGLDALCQKITGAKEKACEFAVSYLTSWISAHDAATACADVHLCNSTRTLS